ncbi:General transcription factor 3C polypeptide 2 [Liparis tanakae]|uniref:General transcription factor 3C polypeptide 2 n=1 Tax=Liparis tanakae TaxID=230148 RepID=A0A4Z2FXG4_9TELE|nr:General transcription factor 3C polypeptide 2 [Liparis tanakae]
MSRSPPYRVRPERPSTARPPSGTSSSPCPRVSNRRSEARSAIRTQDLSSPLPLDGESGFRELAVQRDGVSLLGLAALQVSDDDDGKNCGLNRSHEMWVDQVRFNPNMCCHTWLASGGQSGLVRIHCLRAMIGSQSKKIIGETPSRARGQEEGEEL